jgi:hypothetical protein
MPLCQPEVVGSTQVTAAQIIEAKARPACSDGSPTNRARAVEVAAAVQSISQCTCAHTHACNVRHACVDLCVHRAAVLAQRSAPVVDARWTFSSRPKRSPTVAVTSPCNLLGRSMAPGHRGCIAVADRGGLACGPP